VLPTFIDDFSQNVWIYIVDHKFELFANFKECEVVVEKQAGDTR